MYSDNLRRGTKSVECGQDLVDVHQRSQLVRFCFGNFSALPQAMEEYNLPCWTVELISANPYPPSNVARLSSNFQTAP
nr:hypothetical protein CFP56_54875 [Quercus suber]